MQIGKQKKKRKEALSMVLAFILSIGLASSIWMNPQEAAAADYKIKNLGSVTWGGSTVGHFEVDGAIAFCMEHDKRQPPGGTDATSEVYSNENIAKALYYGWGGPAQWAGFTSEDMGIVITSLTLDYYYSGNPHNLADDFIAYIASQPAPSTTQVTFSKNTVDAKWNVVNKKQYTEDITINGDAGQTISFTIPAGATLVKADGTKLTGSVTLNVGDTFHFEAPSTVSGKWDSGAVGKNFKYQPILLKTAASDYQNLGQGKLISDPSGQTSLAVNWLDFGALELNKINEESSLIDGAEFNLKSADARTGYGEPGITYKVTDGKLSIDPLPAGTYTLTEAAPPDGHGSIVKTFQVVIKKDETTNKVIVNKLNPKGELTITKTDKDSKEPIEGTEFTVYAADSIYDSITFKKVHDKGDKIAAAKTDDKGIATFTGLYMGRYYVQETKAAAGYVPDGKKHEFEFRQEDYTTKIYTHEFKITNKQTETQISKADALNGKELPGAKMQLYDGKHNLVEEWTSTEQPHMIKGLAYGKKYTLHEDTAPLGYELAQDIEFTVGAKTKITMKDEPDIGYIIMQDSPTFLEWAKSAATGDHMRHILPFVCCLIVMSGAGMALSARKKEKTEKTGGTANEKEKNA